jgi:plasmid maintenance system antidote protein VapI
MPKRSTRKRRGSHPHPVRVRPRHAHPGEILREQCMRPLLVTPEILARTIPPHPEFPDSDIAEQIHEFVRADEDSNLDLDLALALDRYFGLSPGYFWRLQAEQEIRDGARRSRRWLARIKPFW